MWGRDVNMLKKLQTSEGKWKLFHGRLGAKLKLPKTTQEYYQGLSEPLLESGLQPVKPISIAWFIFGLFFFF